MVASTAPGQVRPGQDGTGRDGAGRDGTGRDAAPGALFWVNYAAARRPIGRPDVTRVAASVFWPLLEVATLRRSSPRSAAVLHCVKYIYISIYAW